AGIDWLIQRESGQQGGVAPHGLVEPAVDDDTRVRRLRRRPHAQLSLASVVRRRGLGLSGLEREREKGERRHASPAAPAESTKPIPRRDDSAIVAPACISFLRSRATFTSTMFVPGSKFMSSTFSSRSVREMTSPACTMKCSSKLN